MATPLWFRRPLSGGESGPDVTVVNRKLGVPDWSYTDQSIQYVRGLQHSNGLPVTGILGEAEAAILGEAADSQMPPEWFTRDLSLGDCGPDVGELRARLGLPAGEEFDDSTRRAVLRFQSARSFELTGNVDHVVARHLP